MSQDPSTLSTISRCFEIIEILRELDGAGPTAVAERLDIPKSTAFEYLRSLSQTKFVNSVDGTYVLSSYLLTLGGMMRYRNQLYQVAKHEMKRAARETGELIGLGIEDSGLEIALHIEEGDRALSLGIHVGAATPLHTHASGKVILANLPNNRVTEIIEERGLKQRTEHTITSSHELFEELHRIRSRGYAVDWDQQIRGMGMAAVPIIVEDSVLGSLCIVGPTRRIKSRSYQRELLGILEEITQTISINYQHAP